MQGPLQCFCDGEMNKDKVGYILDKRYKNDYEFLDAAGAS